MGNDAMSALASINKMALSCVHRFPVIHAAGRTVLVIISFLLVGKYVFAFIQDQQSQNTGVVIASRRPIEEDDYFIKMDHASNRVTYVRPEAAFYSDLESYAQINLNSTLGDLEVFEAQKKDGRYTVTGRVTGSNWIQEYSKSDDNVGGYPIIAFFVLAGIILSQFKPVSAKAIPVLLQLATVTSGYQYFSHCPTCPQVTALGVPLSIWGIIVFGSMSYAASIGSESRFTSIGLATSLTGVLFVQLYMQFSSGTGCIPCGLIAGLGSLVFGLLMRWEAGERFKLAAYWPTLGIAVAVALVLTAPALPQTSTANSQGASESQDHLVGKSVADLGLNRHSQERIILIAATGCDPCHEAIDWLVSRGITQVHFAFTNEIPTAYSTTASNADPYYFRRTPQFIFLSAEGVIVNTSSGWSDDPEWISSLYRQINTFLSPISTTTISPTGDQNE